VEGSRSTASESIGAIFTAPAFYLLALGSMCSIAAVGGTKSASEAVSEPRSGIGQADAARIISLVLAVSIAGRLSWAGSPIPIARKRVDAGSLTARGRRIPLLARRPGAGRCIYLPRFSGWGWAARPDHSADGGRTVSAWACSGG